MKILVAEDHENTRETYKLMLEAEGHDVVVTNNGQDCIAEYNASLNDDSRHFDLLILDYRLPLRDGMEIARQVLSLVPKQRILIASAYPEDIISKSADGLQCNLELMVKPFDIIEFVDVVNKAKSPAMLVS